MLGIGAPWSGVLNLLLFDGIECVEGVAVSVCELDSILNLCELCQRCEHMMHVFRAHTPSFERIHLEDVVCSPSDVRVVGYPRLCWSPEAQSPKPKRGARFGDERCSAASFVLMPEIWTSLPSDGTLTAERIL